MFYTIIGSVFDAKDISGRSPQVAIPLRSADEIFLVVDAAEEDVAADAHEKDGCCMEV
jgi:hypothetical protein